MLFLSATSLNLAPGAGRAASERDLARTATDQSQVCRMTQLPVAARPSSKTSPAGSTASSSNRAAAKSPFMRRAVARGVLDTGPCVACRVTRCFPC